MAKRISECDDQWANLQTLALADKMNVDAFKPMLNNCSSLDDFELQVRNCIADNIDACRADACTLDPDNDAQLYVLAALDDIDIDSIVQAVMNYFVHKIPVTETIEKDKDIRDFLMSQAVDKKFKVIHGDKPVQRINRFYASTDGPYLFKGLKNPLRTISFVRLTFKNGTIKEVPKGAVEEGGRYWYNSDIASIENIGERIIDLNETEGLQNMLTKSGVTILNKFDDTPIEDRKINYRYYTSEAKKIIADFTEQQLELFQ